MKTHQAPGYRITRQRALAGAAITPLLMPTSAPGAASAQHATPPVAGRASPEIVSSVRYTHLVTISVHAAFGEPSTELLGSDGVHASLEGQAAIAKTVVERLAA